MRSIESSSVELTSVGFEVIGLSSVFGSGVVLLGNSPVQFKNHVRSTSGKALRTFEMNSKLGLLRPLKICEILERCILIILAKPEAVKP